MSSTNRDDLEDVFLSAGGARGAAGGGGGGGGGGGEGGGGAASTVGGSGVGSSGGGGGGSVYNNRPTSSFALDPPHFERQSPLLGVASGSGSGSGRGSGSSGGAGSSGDSGGKAGTLPWQQQVFGWVYALHASLTFCDMFLPTAGMCGQSSVLCLLSLGDGGFASLVNRCPGQACREVWVDTPLYCVKLGVFFGAFSAQETCTRSRASQRRRHNIACLLLSTEQKSSDTDKHTFCDNIRCVGEACSASSPCQAAASGSPPTTSTPSSSSFAGGPWHRRSPGRGMIFGIVPVVSPRRVLNGSPRPLSLLLLLPLLLMLDAAVAAAVVFICSLFHEWSTRYGRRQEPPSCLTTTLLEFPK